MAAKKDDKEITVEAELSVTDAEGNRKILRRFDAAWALSLDWRRNEAEHKMPIYVKFERFARKEGE